MDTFDEKPLLTATTASRCPSPSRASGFRPRRNLLKSHWEFTPRGRCGMPVSSCSRRCPPVSMTSRSSTRCTGRTRHTAGHCSSCTPAATISSAQHGLVDQLRARYGKPKPAGFVTICPTSLHGGVYNYGSAFLPAAYHGISLGTPELPNAPVENAQFRSQKIPDSTAISSRSNWSAAGDEHEAARRNRAGYRARGRIHSFELAFRMQRESAEVLNTSRETAAVKRFTASTKGNATSAYGACWPGDLPSECGSSGDAQSGSYATGAVGSAQQHEVCLERNCAEIDQPVTGLLKDLKSRGMLHDARDLGGEFGRTHGANDDGRDHNPEGFTMWMASGG